MPSPEKVLCEGTSHRKGHSHEAKTAQSASKNAHRTAGGKRKRPRHPKKSTDCRLLSLPGEIREQIFRDALVEPNPIMIYEDGPGEPAILRVCKSIRNEARDIYYCANKFEVYIEDCDAAAVFPFVKQYDSSVAQEKVQRDIDVIVEGIPDPDNITTWMLMNHHNDGPPLLPYCASSHDQPLDTLETILRSSVKISFLMRFQPCGALEQALGAMWDAVDAAVMGAADCDCCSP